jgi:glycosyltransferase involved in cell wall biosynthesis
MEEKNEVLRHSRALLMPLSWEEPFGLVMIEAMLCGCPVIAFPRGSAPELVEEGVTGYLVEDAAQMAEVVRSKLAGFERERCRARAVERFGREQMVAAYERLYEQACREAPRSTPAPLVESA